MAIGGFAGEDHVFAWIAIHEARFFPSGGDATQEIEFELRQFVEVIGLHGHTLYRGLHDDTCCHLEDIGRMTGMTALVILREEFVHDDASPVHRSRGIAAEGVEGEVKGLLDGCALVEEYVL